MQPTYYLQYTYRNPDGLDITLSSEVISTHIPRKGEKIVFDTKDMRRPREEPESMAIVLMDTYSKHLFNKYTVVEVTHEHCLKRRPFFLGSRIFIKTYVKAVSDEIES